MTRFHSWITALLVVVVLICSTAPALAMETKGTIAKVRPERNEFVLTEAFKDLKFQLSSGAQILINGRASKLADLREGDAATVVFDRQGKLLFATAVSVNRPQTVRPERAASRLVAWPPAWEARPAGNSHK